MSWLANQDYCWLFLVMTEYLNLRNYVSSPCDKSSVESLDHNCCLFLSLIRFLSEPTASLRTIWKNVNEHGAGSGANGQSMVGSYVRRTFESNWVPSCGKINRRPWKKWNGIPYLKRKLGSTLLERQYIDQQHCKVELPVPLLNLPPVSMYSAGTNWRGQDVNVNLTRELEPPWQLPPWRA